MNTQTNTSKDSLFNTGIRPLVDEYLAKKAAEVRDYGNYWSASSAGYCMRKVMFDRLGVPKVLEDARKTRVFEVGHVFHQFMQDITKNAGISVAQEVELQDEELMIRGHFDDLVLVKKPVVVSSTEFEMTADNPGMTGVKEFDHLILYDYKTQHSRAFMWAKKENKPLSHYHRMQLGTYMYMLRNNKIVYNDKTWTKNAHEVKLDMKLVWGLQEARIMKISKDDLMMSEQQLLWSPELEKEVVGYWRTLNGYWEKRQIPACTCHLYEINSKTGKGFMADEKYNDYFYQGEPCSMNWATKTLKEGLWKMPEKEDK